MFRQRIIFGQRPPMFEKIAAAFPGAVKPGVIFSWGDKIYNPSCVTIPPELIMHEAVHGERQGHAVEEWWLRYIGDPQFRLVEEIPAHRAEFQHCAERARNRNERRRALTFVALRLSGVLYGNMISLHKAKDAIRGTMTAPPLATPAPLS